ncbi:hypothetical protein [Streptomyces sp. NPDC058579]
MDAEESGPDEELAMAKIKEARRAAEDEPEDAPEPAVEGEDRRAVKAA